MKILLQHNHELRQNNRTISLLTIKIKNTKHSINRRVSIGVTISGEGTI